MKINLPSWFVGGILGPLIFGLFSPLIVLFLSSIQTGDMGGGSGAGLIVLLGLTYTIAAFSGVLLVLFAAIMKVCKFNPEQKIGNRSLQNVNRILALILILLCLLIAILRYIYSQSWVYWILVIGVMFVMGLCFLSDNEPDTKDRR